MVCENVSLIPLILIPYKYSRVPVNKLLTHHQRDPLLLVLFQEGAPFLGLYGDVVDKLYKAGRSYSL